MSAQLEALARKLVAHRLDHPNDTVDFEAIVHEIDVVLTDIGKQRATYPQHIAHAKRMADAYALDFQVDDEPEVEPDEHSNYAAWVACWMLLTYDPSTGNIS